MGAIVKRFDLHLHMRIGILPVFFCLPITILYCKLRTAVQAAEAHHALILHPDRFFVLHLYRLNRAFLRTQSAADTAVLSMQIRRFPDVYVVQWLCDQADHSGGHAR